jgi:hypothetical protein
MAVKHGALIAYSHANKAIFAANFVRICAAGSTYRIISFQSVRAVLGNNLNGSKGRVCELAFRQVREKQTVGWLLSGVIRTASGRGQSIKAKPAVKCCDDAPQSDVKQSESEFGSIGVFGGRSAFK